MELLVRMAPVVLLDQLDFLDLPDPPETRESLVPPDLSDLVELAEAL